MIKFSPAINLLKKTSSKQAAKRCIVGISFVGLSGSCTNVANQVCSTTNITNNFKISTKNIKKSVKWNTAIEKIAQYNKAVIEKNLTKAKKAVVLRIIKEDPNCKELTNKEKIAENIVKIAEEYGADPIHIACIAKKETHFTENLSSPTTKGMMQVTEISVKDMYQRPEIYHKKLKEITSKYKTHKALFDAIGEKPLLNLRIGTLLYLAKLQQAKGNVKKALISYNGSKKKFAYANEVYSEILKYKS